jgi:hypothetical protein
MSSAYCNRSLRARLRSSFVRIAAAAATAALAAGCAGGGSQGNVLVPAGSGANGVAAAGNTVVRIYVPAGSQVNPGGGRPVVVPPAPGGLPGSVSNQAPTAPVTAAPPSLSAGSQALAINVTGPTTISQTLSVGPNSTGCSPAAGGSSCQVGLSLPSGTYAGTIGSAAVAFTVAPGSNNVLNLTLGGTPAQVAVVPASAMSGANAQGGIDLYGAGKHLLLVEMLDANQNIMVGGSGANFALSQSAGSLPVTVAQATLGANAFYVTAGAAPGGSTATLRATANSSGPSSPCAQAGAVCNGTARVDVRQLFAVANSGSSTVSLYITGQTSPAAIVQNGVVGPQALAFDTAGDLFVANQAGSVTVYAPPYNQLPVSITNGVNHPQSLDLDARGDLFVANGNGSNTVTLYSPPYGGAPAATITSNVDDPVNLALDSNANLFVVNATANTITEYAPPYTGTPTTITKGLNTPGSLAIDPHGNLFVANLNSTPNSVVEFEPPFSIASAPVATITNGVNEQGSISVLSSNLFVPNQGANSVTEYSAPYTGTPTTIVGGQSQPIALAIDTAGNLYVANYGNNTVTEYAAPYAPGSWTTIANGVSAPLAIAISPPTGGGAMLLP